MTEENMMIDSGEESVTEDVIESAEPVSEDLVDDDANGSDPGDEADVSKENADDTPFPDKAKKALSRRDKKIAKLEKRLRYYESLQAQGQQNASVAQPPVEASAKESVAPKEEDFDNYADFLEAKILHNLHGKIDEQKKSVSSEINEREKAQRYEAFVQDRTRHIAEKISSREAETPGFRDEYMALYEANADLLSNIPKGIEAAFFDADDPALAFYNLAKDGTLEDVLEMHPLRAAVEIYKAQQKGFRAASPKKQPPAPISGARGTSQTRKSLVDLDGDELLDHLASLANK